jgi:hypothetical protein
MSKELASSTEKLLREYSALVEYWDEEAGDTHELLGARELLVGRTLRSEDQAILGDADRQVIELASGTYENTWDVVMLHKTADLIRGKVLEKKAA